MNPFVVTGAIAIVASTLGGTHAEAQSQATQIVVQTQQEQTGAESGALIDILARSTQANINATKGLKAPLRLRVLLILADPENGGRVPLTSAVRTPAEQQHLVDCHAAHDPKCPNPASPGNKSKHLTGEAADFGGPNDLRNKLANRYGLKQVYPNTDPVHYELDPNNTKLPN